MTKLISIGIFRPRYPNVFHRAKFTDTVIQIGSSLYQVPVRNLETPRVGPPVPDPGVDPVRHAVDSIAGVRSDRYRKPGTTFQLIIALEGPLQSQDDGGDLGSLIGWGWIIVQVAPLSRVSLSVVAVEAAGSSPDRVRLAISATAAVDSEFHTVNHL